MILQVEYFTSHLKVCLISDAAIRHSERVFNRTASGVRAVTLEAVRYRKLELNLPRDASFESRSWLLVHPVTCDLTDVPHRSRHGHNTVAGADARVSTGVPEAALRCSPWRIRAESILDRSGPQLRQCAPSTFSQNRQITK